MQPNADNRPGTGNPDTQVLLRRNNWVRFEKKRVQICTGPNWNAFGGNALATYFPITVQLAPLYQTMTLLVLPPAAFAPQTTVLQSVI
jgi:hypothetical protein